MTEQLADEIMALMLVPGLSGHEDPVRHAIRQRLDNAGIASQTDVMGNLLTSFSGDGPSVLVFAHMDQLGFIVRQVGEDGLLRLERLGGVPERALAAQEVLIYGAGGAEVTGVIANKSHHATSPAEKYTVVPYPDLYVDCGFTTRLEAEEAGVRIGAPVVYAPRATRLSDERICGTSVDDRAGCAILIELARRMKARAGGPPVHIAFTVQEEFNLRGAQTLAQAVKPDIAIQIDLMLASDTPDMADRGDMVLGGGPGMSLYSFHGRGTLNGVIPHPALVNLMETAAEESGVPLQRSAQTGILTDLSYVQLVGSGVAAIDVGFPMRYSHSAREVCDLRDLHGLIRLLETALDMITPGFSLNRDEDC